MSNLRVVVVGGVAGGASAAVRLRRLSEDAEIIVFERGPHVSFANCGLPYFIGGEITREEDLLVQTPEKLHSRFNLDVRVLSEVIAIDRAAKKVVVRKVDTGETYTERYDALVLATGAAPLKPPIPGIDREGQFVLRNVPDTLAIDKWIRKHHARRAVVVGGGYIGLEMAEQLHRRGLHVSVVEALPQVLGILDPEMAEWLHTELRANGVDLHLSDAVAAFEVPPDPKQAAASVVVLKSGTRLPADIVILGIGVKPEAGLARDAGLEIGQLGGVRVDDRMQTSDPAIWAVGDCVEVRHPVTGDWMLIPLAGPANRQGRIAADNIMGKDARYRGTLGTGVLRVFGRAAAGVGANERMLRAAGIPYQTVHLHPDSHAGYYPGAEQMSLKLLFSPDDGKLLGAQAIGADGVDKRIDVLATALSAGMTVRDLVHLELAYAPPFGSAKDPVNLAGMVAENVLDGLVSVVQWHDIDHIDPERTVLLDVRYPDECEKGTLPGALRIPLPELRERLGELPKDKEILAYCQAGQRSYYACRILAQRGFRCRNLTGAYMTWSKRPRAGRSGAHKHAR